jgi:hypothetical protein
MIAIICGGRAYGALAANEPRTAEAIERIEREQTRLTQILDAAVDRLGLHTIIEGGASGADRLAYEWAERRGDIGVIEVPADWSKGKGAGHARNSIMLTMLQRSDEAKAVIAFPGGAGTANMVKIAGFATRGRDAVDIRIIEVDKPK